MENTKFMTKMLEDMVAINEDYADLVNKNGGIDVVKGKFKGYIDIANEQITQLQEKVQDIMIDGICSISDELEEEEND